MMKSIKMTLYCNYSKLRGIAVWRLSLIYGRNFNKKPPENSEGLSIRFD